MKKVLFIGIVFLTGCQNPISSGIAKEGDKTRALAISNGHEPIVPPKSNRKDPWEYDKEKYKRRNVVERLFRRLKEFRRVCTRYDKTDIAFHGHVDCAITQVVGKLFQH